MNDRPTHASHYSTRKTDLVPSKRERRRGGWGGGWYHAPQASFQVYLTFPMSTRSKAEYAASIPQGPAQCVNITII